jgi:hypothetical protein
VQRRVRGGAATAAVLVLLAPAAAKASTCEVYRQPLKFATQADVDMIVDSGRDCRVRFPADEVFDIEKNEVTGRPSYGGVKVDGTAGVYYRSNPGYRGPDRFAFTLCGHEGDKAGCSVIRVKVRVR